MNSLNEHLSWDEKFTRYAFNKTYHDCDENEVKIQMLGAFDEFRVDHLETIQDGFEPGEKEIAWFLAGKPGSEPAVQGVIGPDQISIGFGLLNGTLEATLLLTDEFDESEQLARRFDEAISVPKAA
ncbi:MAG: hypothetical protein ABJL67_20700 [Sulfitobacter sp.]